MSENERLLIVEKEKFENDLRLFCHKSTNPDDLPYESYVHIYADKMFSLAFAAGEKKQRIEDQQIWNEQQQTIRELKLNVDALYQKEKGEFWYWQGDGEDHLESTTCPILIKAQDLRSLISEAEKRGATMLAYWGNGVCPHISQPSGRKHACDICWQSKLKSLEG